MIWLGVDPGLSGGIGVIQTNNLQGYKMRTEAHKMPSTEMDLYELLNGIIQPLDGFEPNAFAYLERAHAFPGGTKYVKCPSCGNMLRTRVSQGVHSTWKFAENFGSIKGILTALHIPFELVTSHVWQKGMGCLTGGDKNISKAKAQQLFPDIKCTHAISDALLICEFGRRMRNQGVSFKEKPIPVA